MSHGPPPRPVARGARAPRRSRIPARGAAAGAALCALLAAAWHAPVLAQDGAGGTGDAVDLRERGAAAAAEAESALVSGGRPPLTHAGVVAQVWRGGAGRQARLAKALRSIETAPLDLDLARRSGVLLARSGMRDVIDAAAVALAENGDRIVTSDPDDIATLAAVGARRVDIVPA